MKFVLLTASLAMSGMALAQEAAPSDFEYHGYMRSGIGASRGGTDQTCFRAPGTDGGYKFRLGNECETYIETSFTKLSLLGKTKNDPIFRTVVTVAAVTASQHDWEPTTTVVKGTDATTKEPILGSELTLSLREAYVQAENVLGSTKPWVGKRFYRRQDIHILDYYMIADVGPGAGVENIDLGAGLLHLAAFRNVPGGTGDGPAQTNTDVRFSDMKLGTAGKLEALAIYGVTGKRGHESGADAWEPLAGTQLGVVHTVDALGGNNRVTLQYGQGIFGADGLTRTSTLNENGGSPDHLVAKGQDKTRDARKDSKTTRVAEELTEQFGKTFANSFVLLYQNADFGGMKDAAGKAVPNKSEMTGGFRPVYSFTDTTALALEYGFTNVKNAFLVGSDYKNATLQKVTIAPQVTAGPGFWARPQLRLFATYASWNADSKGQIGGPVYASATNGFSTGAQLEAWW